MSARGITFLVRSHRWDPVVAALVADLHAEGLDILITADERAGPVASGDLAKVQVSPALAHPAAPPRPKDWGWLCGDLCLYAGADARPAIDRFVLLDGDVQFGPGALSEFIRRLGELDADAAAAELKLKGADKRLSRGLAALGRGADVGCLFPVVYARRAVIDAMRALRREIVIQRPILRINDEAVLASVLREGDFNGHDLRAWSDLFPSGTYGVDTLSLHREPPERRGGVAHPVLTFGAAVSKAAEGDRLVVRRMRRGELASPAEMAAFERAAAHGGGGAAQGARRDRLALLLAGLPAFDGVKVQGNPQGLGHLRSLGQIRGRTPGEAADVSDEVAPGVLVVIGPDVDGVSEGRSTEPMGLHAHTTPEPPHAPPCRTGQAVQVRDIGRLSDRDLSALAVIACDVLQAHDVAVEALETLASRGAVRSGLAERYCAQLAEEGADPAMQRRSMVEQRA